MGFDIPCIIKCIRLLSLLSRSSGLEFRNKGISLPLSIVTIVSAVNSMLETLKAPASLPSLRILETSIISSLWYFSLI